MHKENRNKEIKPAWHNQPGWPKLINGLAGPERRDWELEQICEWRENTDDHS